MKSLNMKSFLFSTAIVLLCASCTSNSGDDNIIVYFTNYRVNFSVIDDKGNDLLDTATQGNILENDLKVEYKGKTYVYEKNASQQISDTLLPLALRIEYIESLKSHLLSFGEFSPTKNYKGENFTIDWGNGTVDAIKFDLYITEELEGTVVNTVLYFNDKIHPNTSRIIKIIK